MDAVTDVGKAPGLLAVTPDLDLVVAAELGLRDFSTDRGGGLLAPALEGPVRAVDVVVTDGDSAHPEVLGEVPAHALRKELLPSITVLGHCRVSIVLTQRLHLCLGLLVGCVYAGRRGEEV